MTKKNWMLVSVLTVFILGMTPFLYQMAFHSGSEGESVVKAGQDFAQGTIVVSEMGEVSVEPDMVYIQLGAEAIDSSADDAQREVNKHVNAARQVLADFGVEEEHIQTIRLNVHPYQQYDPNGRMEEGRFRAEHMLEVKYMDIETIGELIDAVSNAGANRIEQTRFALQNSDEAEHEALRLAIEKTAKKANVMAESAGRQKGEVLQIVDQQAQIQLPIQHHDLARQEMAFDGDDSGSTIVESGKVQITQRVDVVYQLR